MSLAERLAAQTPDARRPRVRTPKANEAGVKWSSDGTAEITTPPMPHLATEKDWQEAVEGLYPGVVPPGHRLRLVEARHYSAAWHRAKQGEDALTAPSWFYRFIVEPIPSADQYDHVASLKAWRPTRRRVTPVYDGNATLGVSWNDWQAGKTEGGGSAALEARFLYCLDETRERGKELARIGRTPGDLLIIGGGDINEGCDIFPNQAWQLDLDVRGQIRFSTDLVLRGLDELAPLFRHVTVMAVGGNHGENRRGGGARVNRHDNSDLTVFENAARTAERDRRLSHVDFVIAQGEPVKAVNVNGFVVATTHGHAYGKSQAGSLEGKVYRWISARAAGRLPGGDADLLITHHYHHRMSRDYGSLLWQQTPALDGGSLHFTDYSGMFSRPGMLTWVTTPDRRYQDELVIEPPYENEELGLKYA